MWLLTGYRLAVCIAGVSAEALCAGTFAAFWTVALQCCGLYTNLLYVPTAVQCWHQSQAGLGCCLFAVYAVSRNLAAWA